MKTAAVTTAFLSQPIMSHNIDTYVELKRQIHQDLRAQHPDWIKPTGECPECDEHEARLRKLLDSYSLDHGPIHVTIGPH